MKGDEKLIGRLARFHKSFRAHGSRAGRLWLVGLALYIGAVWLIGWQEIGQALVRAKWPILVCLAAVDCGAIGTRMLKWRIALGAGQRAPALFMLSKAAGGWSPGRIGELAPLLLRKHRTPRTAAWIVLDRLLETATTLTLGLLGLLWLQTEHKFAIALPLCAALVILVGAPLLGLTRRGFFLWCKHHTRETSVLHRIATMLLAVADEFVGLRKLVPAASTLTIVATCIDVSVSVLLYLAFGYRVSFALLATVQCVHGITSAIPFTPNATGVPFLVTAGLLYKLGGLPEDVLAASLAVRLAIQSAVFWSVFGLAGTIGLKAYPGTPGQPRSDDDSP